MKTLNTYIINLDKSVDRLSQIKNHLKKYDATFERVAAVDGRDLDPATLADYDATTAAIYMGRDLVGGEIGCFRSHLKAAKTFLVSDANYALVLEDDAKPLCNIHALLEKAISDLDKIDPSWLLLNAGNSKLKLASHLRSYTESDQSFELVAAHYFPMAAHAIVWSRLGAEIFVKEHDRIFSPVDNLFRHWLTRAGHGYCFSPAPVRISNSQSLIFAAAMQKRKTNKRRWHYGLSKQRRMMIDKLIAIKFMIYFSLRRIR